MPRDIFDSLDLASAICKLMFWVTLVGVAVALLCNLPLLLASGWQGILVLIVGAALGLVQAFLWRGLGAAAAYLCILSEQVEAIRASQHKQEKALSRIADYFESRRKAQISTTSKNPS